MKTFTETVRSAARGMGGQFVADDLQGPCAIQTREQLGRLRQALRDMVRTGEVGRVSPGVFVYNGREQRASVKKCELMWRLIRKGAVTVERLQEFADASGEYAREWLGFLIGLDLVREENGLYRLIRDQVQMPANDAKAKKLREIRARKKARIAAALYQASTVCMEAARFLEDGAGECE